MRNNITIRGQWIYPREAVNQIMGLIEAVLIDLAVGEVTSFS